MAQCLKFTTLAEDQSLVSSTYKSNSQMFINPTAVGLTPSLGLIVHLYRYAHALPYTKIK